MLDIYDLFKKFENYKQKTYELSDYLFEILKCELTLNNLLSEKQIYAFEKYKSKVKNLIQAETLLAIKFVINNINDKTD